MTLTGVTLGHWFFRPFPAKALTQGPFRGQELAGTIQYIVDRITEVVLDRTLVDSRRTFKRADVCRIPKQFFFASLVNKSPS
jgi:hypothetical protein